MEIQTNQVKTWIWQAVGVLLIAFLAITIIDKIYTFSQSVKNNVPKNTLSMSAEGKVTARPDLATITVGVTINTSAAKTAAEEVSTRINQITNLVKQQGVDAKDITTSNYSVYPNTDYQNGQKITGYTANETLNVKVHGVDQGTDKVSKILDIATSNGSNQIQGVYFSFDDPDNLKQEARKQAIDKAKQKAADLATASGLKLGRVINVSESGNSPYPMPYAVDSKMGMGGGAASAPNIETGTQDITANMTLIFEIK